MGSAAMGDGASMLHGVQQKSLGYDALLLEEEQSKFIKDEAPKSRSTTERGTESDDLEAHPLTADEIVKEETELDTAALDSIVNANSFFAVAVFVGIGSNTISPQLPQGIESSNCHPVSSNTSQLVFMFEVVAFGCFLLSTLFAVGLKLMVTLNSNRPDGVPKVKEEFGRLIFKVAMVVSAMGLIAGMILLVFSLIFYVEVFAGPLKCSPFAAKSIVILIVFTAIGMLFILLVLFMFLSWFYYVRVGSSQMLKLKTMVRRRANREQDPVTELAQ